jgi:hypothetical protein
VCFAISPHRTQPPTRYAHDDGGDRDAASKSSSVVKLTSAQSLCQRSIPSAEGATAIHFAGGCGVTCASPWTSISSNFGQFVDSADGRQSNLPVVLPHLKMLPKVSKHFLSILISPTA